MNAFFEYTLGAAVRVADTVLRLLPVPVTAKPLHRLEESANAVRRPALALAAQGGEVGLHAKL
nr:hypothetical protein [Candidatus Hydrogenedentota bacterium]